MHKELSNEIICVDIDCKYICYYGCYVEINLW